MLGINEPNADGVCGLVSAGAVVVNNYVEKSGTAAYLITSLSDVTKTGTDLLTYEMIREFFAEAGDGAYLWVLSAAPTDSATGVTSLQTLANGACRIIGVVEPLEAVATDVPDLQSAAEELAEDLYAPALIIAGIEAPSSAGSASSLTGLASSSVAVVCGNEKTGDTDADAVLDDAAAVGLVLGRLAKNAVQVSIARVADGAIKADDMKFGTADVSESIASTLSSKGYIVPRTWVGKAGFYWSTDSTATAETDDCSLIMRRRTIDKAYRVSYKSLLENVGMQIPVNSTGGIPVATAKSIEAAVETALERAMTNQGNLGTDPDDDTDNGIKVYVDPTQNVVSTNTLTVSIRVKPFGYAYYIEANLSFYTQD